MNLLRSRNTLAFAVLCVVLNAGTRLRAEGEFRRFPETISPDGAYVLGWGAREHPKDALASLKDVSAEKEKGPGQGSGDDWENYLVDAISGKPLAVIPEFHYFAGPEGRENHNGIYAAWAPGSKTGLAIYDGRWSYVAVAWLEPAERRCISIGKQLEDAFRRELRKEKQRGGGEVSFQSAVLVKPDTLIIEAWGQVPKSDKDPVYHYRLKFRVNAAEGKVRLELLKSHSISENEDTGKGESDGTEEEAETTLNKLYGKLRAKLDEAGRESLKAEEKKWLSLREAMDSDYRLDFTRHRIVELRGRASDW